MTQSENTDHDYKAGRVLEEYGLDDMAEQLVPLWEGQTRDKYSLRELADMMNRRVLESEMRDAGMHPIDGEAGNFYELLTNDDVSSSARIEAERRLDREGVDIKRVKKDFVSHQAIHTYLTKSLGATWEHNSLDLLAASDSINRLKSRVRTITENTLRRLQKVGILQIGEVRVLLTVQVHCQACRERYEFDDLLERGGCGCNERLS